MAVNVLIKLGIVSIVLMWIGIVATIWFLVNVDG